MATVKDTEQLAAMIRRIECGSGSGGGDSGGSGGDGEKHLTWPLVSTGWPAVDAALCPNGHLASAGDKAHGRGLACGVIHEPGLFIRPRNIQKTWVKRGGFS